LKCAENHPNQLFANIIKKYGKENLLFDVVEKDLTREEAVCLEMHMISLYGRRDLRKGPLANMTDGGDGTTRIVVSDVWRKRRKEFLKEFWSNPANHEEASSRLKGNSHKKGKPNSELWRQRTIERMMGNTNTLGWHPSEETRQKMKWSDEKRERMTAIRKESGLYTHERCVLRWKKRKENAACTGKST
jgi:hypothetical protein